MSSQQVLVYYANENEPSEPYLRIIKWLNGSLDPDFIQLATRVEEDLREFPKAINADLGGIWRGLMAAEHRLADLGLLVLTNQSVREGSIYCADPIANQFRRVEFRTPRFEHVQFQLHPLSNPEVFGTAMRTAADLFGADASFTVVTKSHGSSNMALTSLFSAMLDIPCKEDFLAEVNRLRPSNSKFFRRVRERHSVEGTLGEVFLGVIFLGELTNGIGTSKELFVDVLSSEELRRLRIDLLLMESCDSNLQEELVQKLADNVSRLFTAADTVPYSSVNYQDILLKVANGSPLPDAFASSMPHVFARQR